MNSTLTFVWSPVVLWPSQDFTILFVLLLQPLDERLEILHQRLDRHFGLASNQSHGFRPGFTEAHLHHITEKRVERFFSQAKMMKIYQISLLHFLALVKTGKSLIDLLTPGVSLLLWTCRYHSCGAVLADRRLHTGPCGTGTGLQNSQSTY